MTNFTLASANHTRVIVTVLRLSSVLYIAPFVLFAIFMYFLLWMLKVFFTTADLRENSRYILFAYVMANDTVYLFICCVLFALTRCGYSIPTLACALLVGITSATFSNTPSGLAAMAIERYIAICLPLRHAEICRADRCLITVGVICCIGALPYLIDCVILSCSVQQNFFFQQVVCSREALIVRTLQTVLRFAAHGTIFTVVTLVIVYTYIAIMLEAKKLNRDQASSSKARKTVVLHSVQLLLCLTSFSFPITEQHFQKDFTLKFFNMCILMILPRCLSPLIYGLRDEAFQKHMDICFSRPTRRTYLKACRVGMLKRYLC
ncbi:odorant receptor 131-2-like [Ambystoma mexicanum]|uniref:odorant receptor 131-2-like n=1 Tax=Ambystoma mexicanum TaxID=8296 RepID=UPI0037E95194